MGPLQFRPARPITLSTDLSPKPVPGTKKQRIQSGCAVFCLFTSRFLGSDFRFFYVVHQPVNAAKVIRLRFSGSSAPKRCSRMRRSVPVLAASGSSASALR